MVAFVIVQFYVNLLTELHVWSRINIPYQQRHVYVHVTLDCTSRSLPFSLDLNDWCYMQGVVISMERVKRSSFFSSIHVDHKPLNKLYRAFHPENDGDVTQRQAKAVNVTSVYARLWSPTLVVVPRNAVSPEVYNPANLGPFISCKEKTSRCLTA